MGIRLSPPPAGGNQPSGALSRQVPHILDIGAGIEVGVAATKTFLGQLAFMAWRWPLLPAVARPVLRSMPWRKNWACPSNCASWWICTTSARSRPSFAGLYAIFLGRGINYPIALEGALKLKEISYIHAEGYPAGEMKHGPIALLDSRVPVVQPPCLVWCSRRCSATHGSQSPRCPADRRAPEIDICLTNCCCAFGERVDQPLLTVVPMQLLVITSPPIAAWMSINPATWPRVSRWSEPQLALMLRSLRP